MTKALLEKDGVNWRQKLPPIPAVPVSAQTRWSVPSAQAPGANTPPATAPRGEGGGSVPLGWAESPVAPKGDEQDSCHTCLVCLQPGLVLPQPFRLILVSLMSLCVASGMGIFVFCEAVIFLLVL